MQNKQRQLKRFVYHVRHQYMTTNNAVLLIAAFIAVSWAWASVQAVQRNYQLEREVNDKKKQLQLTQLQTENLQFEQRYYKSREFQTLEAKRVLGLAEPGEKLLILPPNSPAVIAADKADQSQTVTVTDGPAPPPIQQWVDFLFGRHQQ